MRNIEYHCNQGSIMVRAPGFMGNIRKYERIRRNKREKMKKMKKERESRNFRNYQCVRWRLATFRQATGIFEIGFLFQLIICISIFYFLIYRCYFVFFCTLHHIYNITRSKSLIRNKI